MGPSYINNALRYCTQIVVVNNAVSDVRGTFQIGVPLDNQGGAYVRRESGEVGGGAAPCDRQSRCVSNVTTILMDDLVEVVDFHHAVMKIDIEGQERRAFFHADRLFDNVNIGYIFMEWIKLRASVTVCCFCSSSSSDSSGIIGVARGEPGGLGPQREWKKFAQAFLLCKGANIYVKVLRLLIVNVNVTKYMPQKCQK